MNIVQWLESLDDVWPSCVPGGLDIDKEVQSLSAIGIEHSVVGWGCQERAIGRVLAVQRVQDWIDVQQLKGSRAGQGSLFMPDVQGSIVEPDICFD